jgi:hypothetical protein
MSDSVTQAVYEWVSRNVPTQFGPVTDLHSIEFTAPVVQSLDNGRVTYGTSASARVNFSLTPQMSQQIRQLVKGQSVEQARQLISQQYANYLSVGPIRANVLWFNVDKLPNDPARIVVALGDSPVYVPPTQP